MRACVLAILLASGPTLADVSSPATGNQGDPLRCDAHAWEQAPFFRDRKSGAGTPFQRGGWLPVENETRRWVGSLRISNQRGGVVVFAPAGRDLSVVRELITFRKDWARFHDAATVIARGDLVFVAHFSHYSTGSGLFAFDRATLKPLWEADVEQLRVAHSEYFNDVTLALDGNSVVLTGIEAGGCTVQRFDVATGKRLSSWVKRLW